MRAAKMGGSSKHPRLETARPRTGTGGRERPVQHVHVEIYIDGVGFRREQFQRIGYGGLDSSHLGFVRRENRDPRVVRDLRVS